MNRYGNAARLVAVAGAALLLGCDDGPSGPVPGELVVSINTPFADDRAVVVSVTAPGTIQDVQPAAPGLTVYSRPEGTGVRAAVFGPIADGPLIRFTVPDVRDAKSYTAVVQEAADATNALRPTTAGYTTRVGR